MNRGRLKKIVLVAVVIYIIWKFLSGLIGGLDRDTDKYLVDRIWIERLPKDEREMVHMLLLIDVRDYRGGAAMYGSMYRRTIDIFTWKLSKNELVAHYLQDDVKKSYTLKTWQCPGEAPAPFDLCLELKSGSKTERYYSKEEWGRGAENAPVDVAEVEQMLEKSARE